MKLKYYLRGLGIGMIVTALLMGFATKDNNELSDAEIKARAAELGMVEQRTLADIRNDVEPTEMPAVTEVPATVADATKAPSITEAPGVTETPVEIPSVTETPVVTQVPAETEVPTATEIPTEAPVETEEPVPTQEPEENVEQPPIAEISGDSVRITIFSGNNSVNVSKVLAEAGLVESAVTFDRYLRNNGYSKIINTGTYVIPVGTSEAEIARIITNTN